MARHEWQWASAEGASFVLPAPDASQAAAIAHERGPALVLGAPGTGRTTTAIAAALARIDAGAAPEAVVILASNRDAAAAVRERCTLLRPDGAAPRVATFHSLALDIVTRATVDGEPVRLLSGAEQERAVREVIAGTLEADAEHWPASLREALGTRAFAKEVRSAFAAARALGLSGDEVTRIGQAGADDAWGAIGHVLDQYLETQELQSAVDYTELMFRAVAALHHEANRRLFESLSYVYVDEFEETDGMQLAFLVEVSRFARCLVAFACPDTSVFSFRGARPANVAHFMRRFEPMAKAHGTELPALLTLRVCHRSGARLQAFANDAFGGVAVPELTQIGIDTAVHRAPLTQGPDTRVDVALFDDASSEAAHVLRHVRDLATDQGLPWSDIAVITRSATTLQQVRRALERGGVPVTTDVRSAGISEEPAVRTLLRALAVVAMRVPELDPVHAHELLLSPLGGLDPTEVRGIARVLRPDRRMPSDEALAMALVSSHPVFELDDALPGAASFEALRALLMRVHDRVRTGATPHEALWLLWEGTAWPERLHRQAVEHASPAAHRDLDAICELFDIADRAVQRRQGRAGVAAFVDEVIAQEVPSDTLASRGFLGPAVQLVTAHAAKGREWRHVIVAGVNEGVWPNLRRRGSLLDVDRLTPQRLELPRTAQALFDEERRLFHLACTRARETLLVSGVAGERESAEQPSRFLMNGVVPAQIVHGRPEAHDAPDDLVAHLRFIATSTKSTPALREAAAQRLRAMAAMTDAAGDALFPLADAQRWWGMRGMTSNDVPVHRVDAPLYVRGSSLDSLTRCSLQWFLSQRASAESVRGTALVFGSAIHALAQAVATRELPPDAQVLSEHLRAAWNAHGYDAAWQSQRDFEEGVAAIGRFLAWHATRNPSWLGAELAFEGELAVRTPSGATERLLMRGSLDRIEVSSDGEVSVFDFKTGRSKYSNADVEDSGQLRYYQLAVAEALVPLPSGVQSSAHAAFVHLRMDASAKERGIPAVQRRPPLASDDPWTADVLGAALETVRSEAFVATVGPQCTYCQMKTVCPARREGRVETA